ncbi:MAG: PDZ domain-containing protein, partial [Candidatus Ozemobacteraceae bacterium]
TTRVEFSDLLWEMQGELGTSHAYEFGGDHRPSPSWGLGLLGADLAFDRKKKTWTIARIVQGDSWNEHAASPLAASARAVLWSPPQSSASRLTQTLDAKEAEGIQ